MPVTNSSTRVHAAVTEQFRASLSRLPKGKVSKPGDAGLRKGATNPNPAIQVLKDLGIPVDDIKRL